MKKQLVAVLLLYCWFFPACYGVENSRYIQMRTISIPPYGIEGSKHLGGIYYELANLLAKESGYQAENYIYPYARIRGELKSGQTDLTIMFKYDELADYVTYIVPLPSLKNVVIGRADSSFQSIESLEGKTLAYLRGANFSEEIDEDPHIYKQRITNFEQGIHMLALGRVDAIIGPLVPIMAALHNSQLSVNLLGQPFTVSERTPWLQMSKKSRHHHAIDNLRKHFNIILKRGELDRLRKKYTPPNQYHPN